MSSTSRAGWCASGAVLPRDLKPEFEGVEILVHVHKAVPYVWMGSIEVATVY